MWFLSFENLNVLSVSFFKINLKEADRIAISLILINPGWRFGTLTSSMAHLVLRAPILILDRLILWWGGNWSSLICIYRLMTSHLFLTLSGGINGFDRSDWANIPWLWSLRLSLNLWWFQKFLHRLSILSWNPLILWLWHFLIRSELLDRLRLELNSRWLVFKLGCKEFFLLFFDHLRSQLFFLYLIVRHVSKFEIDASYLLIIETKWWSANQVPKDSHLVD